MRPKKKGYSPFLIAVGAGLVMIAAYYCAAGMRQGETIFLWEERMQTVMQNPMQNYFNAYTVKTLLVFGIIYFLAVLMHITSRKNYLPGREMGSAQYADVKKVNQKLADLSQNPDDPQNIIILKKSRWRKLQERIRRKGSNR